MIIFDSEPRVNSGTKVIVKNVRFFQAWVRVESDAPAYKAYVFSSDVVNLALQSFAPDRVAVIFDVLPGVCLSSPAISTCHCGPRVLNLQVNFIKRFQDTFSSLTEF